MIWTALTFVLLLGFWGAFVVISRDGNAVHRDAPPFEMPPALAALQRRFEVAVEQVTVAMLPAFRALEAAFAAASERVASTRQFLPARAEPVPRDPAGDLRKRYLLSLYHQGRISYAEMEQALALDSEERHAD